MFDKISSNYDNESELFLEELTLKWRKNVVKLIAPKNLKILDVAIKVEI